MTKASYQTRDGGGEFQVDMLAGLELAEEAFAAIKKHCDEQGVVFLATPFGPADVARLASLQVAALKIASTDLTNEPLLDAAHQTGLPLILSTGASTEDEIRRCVGARAQQGALDRLILMHCVSAYPTPLDAINLRAIATLRQAFRVPCGLSDHTTSVETGHGRLPPAPASLKNILPTTAMRPVPTMPCPWSPCNSASTSPGYASWNDRWGMAGSVCRPWRRTCVRSLARAWCPRSPFQSAPS
ncbi:MAG: N-acetylneuraminate synthase family protein [Planctomycetes bacterium]|nr:N-acetylneuraminate synthase family protein [Planctomycetota bacterium]